MVDKLDQYLDSGSSDAFLDADQGADHFLDQEPGAFRKALKATDMPMRGLRGVGVGAESLIEGKGVQPSLERASAATEEGYQPKPGEKIGAFAGEMSDPRFMLFGAAGEGVAATGLGKAVMGGAAALGGTEAVEETAEGGHPTLAKTGEQAAIGAVGGAALHGAAKILEPILSPVIKQAGEFLKSIIGNKDPESFGKVVQAGETLTNKIGEGKTLQEAAKEMGVGEDTARKAVEKFEKSKPHVVETSLLPEIDKAMQGDKPSQVNVLQKVMKNFYGSQTEASTTAANLFKRRYSEVALGKFESHLFQRETLRGLSDVERKAMPFILEKKTPDLDKFYDPKKVQILQAAEDYMENPGKFPKLQAAVDKIGNYLDEGHAFLKDYYDDIGFREDYINHIWEKPPQIGSTGPGKTSLSQYNPFSKRRFIASYADGINQGLTPKELDIGKLLEVYDNYKIKTVANVKFVDALKEMTVEGGYKAILPSDKAPSDWMLVDNSALNRKKLLPGDGDNPPMFVSQPVRVSPEVAPAVRAIIDRPFASVNPGPHAGMIEKAFYHGSNAYENLNAITKKLKLSLSFFHHYALTETAMLTGDPTAPFRVMWKSGRQILDDAGMNPGELYKAFRDGHPAFQNIPLAKDAIAHGLTLNPIGDVQSSRVEKMLSSVEGQLNRVSGLKLGNIVTPIRTFNEIWDKALWDYYAAGLKMDLYERQVAKNIQKFGDKMTAEEIKRQTADFINKSSGGSLETLMTSPRYKQMIQWALLAPDWTLGRLQMFGSVFSGEDVTRHMGRKFWIKAGLAYATAINSWNYLNTQKDGLTDPDGKPGRFLWQNEQGKKLSLYIGKDPDTGRNQYVLPAKAVTEIVDWFQDPFKVFGRKAAPVFQMMVHAMYDQTPRGQAASAQEDKTVGGFLRRYVLPIGADQKHSYLMTLPKSYGMSKSSIIDMMQRGYESGDMSMVAAAESWAIENDFDAENLRKIAYGNVTHNTKKALLQ
jgi:hypothetical protein